MKVVEASFWEQVQLATSATIEAIRLWGRVFYPLIAGVVNFLVQAGTVCWDLVSRFAIFVWPYVTRGTVALWNAVIETDPVILASLGVGVILLVLAWLLKRTLVRRRVVERVHARYRQARDVVRRRYHDLLEGVRRKSRTLALLLPHLSVVVLAIFTLVVIPGPAAPIVSAPGGLLVVGAVIPLLANVKVLKFSQRIVATDVTRWLSYWTVFAAFMFATHLPFVPGALQYVPYANEASFFFVLWLLLPWTDGSTVALQLLVPFISRHIRNVPDATAQRQQGYALLDGLVFLRIISDATRRVCVEIIRDTGSTVLLGLVFFFTPGFVTHYGCMLVGVGYPVYASATALAAMRAETNAWWLTYWTAFALVAAAFSWLSTLLGWLPLWNHVQLLIAIWLQLPYLRGAQRLLDLLTRHLDWGVESALAWATPAPAARTPARAQGRVDSAEPSAMATPSAVLLERRPITDAIALAQSGGAPATAVVVAADATPR